MRILSSISVCKVYCFIIILFSTIISFGQIDSAKLARLKDKYPWGNIYLTYSKMLDLKIRCQTNQNLNAAARPTTKSSAEIFKKVVSDYSTLNLNTSIAFLEINLNLLKAGWKSAADNDAVIHVIPWSNQEVLEVACLLDDQINGREPVLALFDKYFYDQTPGKNILTNLSTNILENDGYTFISKEKCSLLMMRTQTLAPDFNIGLNIPPNEYGIGKLNVDFRSIGMKYEPVNWSPYNFTYKNGGILFSGLDSNYFKGQTPVGMYIQLKNQNAATVTY